LDIAIIGIPFDGGTTNRPGTRHGPRELRASSTLMRRVNPVTGVAPYELCAVADLGDVTTNPVDVLETLELITAQVAEIRAGGAWTLVAGGDHLISLPILRGIVRASPALAPLGMVHFDAHSDTNDSYFGGNRFTHGTPFRRAIEEGLLDPKRIVQIGIRGSLYAMDDMDWARAQGVRIITIEECERLGPDAVVAEARRVVGMGPTYLSFDIDSLDPAFAPGTGTPEPGGLSSSQVLTLLEELAPLNWVGMDCVEVAPAYDHAELTSNAAAHFVWTYLCGQVAKGAL
jgi:guanidinopropionase